MQGIRSFNGGFQDVFLWQRLSNILTKTQNPLFEGAVITKLHSITLT